ncbi:MAG: hypothetical protein KTV72_03300, partial [Wolbachia endosymbiont of Melophagus ovinus]|nr:hypothetical protein [Wolbachia endosymbiont of Melophagus ovinus]
MISVNITLAVQFPPHRKPIDKSRKSYPTKTKKLLDNLRRYPYHDTEAIYLSSQSLQWIND